MKGEKKEELVIYYLNTWFIGSTLLVVTVSITSLLLLHFSTQELGKHHILVN